MIKNTSYIYLHHITATCCLAV